MTESPGMSGSLMLSGMPIPSIRHSQRSESLGRPIHASPDSRPPARVRQLSVDSNQDQGRSTLSFGDGARQIQGHVSSDDMREGSETVPIQADNLEDYVFPRHRLPFKLRGSSGFFRFSTMTDEFE